jgi:hypothetical protein
MFADTPASFLSPILGVAAIIDLPLSAVADTVLLPWSIYQRHESHSSAPPAEDTQNTGQPVP